jgi:hypothetical protein
MIPMIDISGARFPRNALAATVPLVTTLPFPRTTGFCRAPWIESAGRISRSMQEKSSPSLRNAPARFPDLPTKKPVTFVKRPPAFAIRGSAETSARQGEVPDRSFICREPAGGPPALLFLGENLGWSEQSLSPFQPAFPSCRGGAILRKSVRSLRL